MSAPDCRSVPRVLSIAGSDSGGGAGIQADLKTIAAWGGYGLTAITAVTAQNTQGVQAVHPLPVDVVRAQLDSVAADIGLDAVKIGMLGSPELRDAVRDWLERVRPPRVVLDPVMVASSGDALSDAAVPAGWAPLLAAVDVVTPNLPELAALTGAPEPLEIVTGMPESFAACAKSFAGRACSPFDDPTRIVRLASVMRVSSPWGSLTWAAGRGARPPHRRRSRACASRRGR